MIILSILMGISVCFGCNYVTRDTSPDKAAVPLNVCYGSSFFGYTIYKCEDGVPFKYRYSSSNPQCSGNDYIDRTSAADENYNCAADANCEYVKITEYGTGSCDAADPEIGVIETFVVGKCVDGTKGTCSDTTAMVRQYDSDSCSGSHSYAEEYERGCLVTQRGNEYQVDIECGSDCTRFGVAFVSLFVVLISLYAM